tara:strand:+ start:5064 stop:7394 length:2331 start_codon:yes stop_codon:yes gene_type:complete
MAETLISPGVLARENDQSFVTSQPVERGAALIGPTALGPVERPTLISSFSSYQAIFGGALQSGSNEYTYLTSIAANQYFQNGGNSLLITRVASGSSANWSSATSTTIQNNVESTTSGLVGSIFSGLQPNQGSGSAAPATYSNVALITGTGAGSGATATVTTSNSNGILIKTTTLAIAGSAPTTTLNATTAAQAITTAAGTGATVTITSAGLDITTITVVLEGTLYVPEETVTITAATLTALTTLGTVTGDLTFTIGQANVLTEISAVQIVQDGTDYASGNTLSIAAGDVGTPAVAPTFILTDAMIENNPAFELETISEGTVMNNTFPFGSDTSGAQIAGGALVSGSAENLRWQITSVNTSSGVFSLAIRRGNDDTNRPVVLETFNNVSLDPFAPNYISRAIGDISTNLVTEGVDTFLQESGSFPQISSYVRVKSVNSPTPRYFENNGVAKNEFTSSLPQAGSGSFDGAVGSNIPVGRAANFYQNISVTDSQGLVGTDYTNAIALMANQDDYQYNVISVPGLTNQTHAAQITSLMNTSISRGDSIAVIDLVTYNQPINTVVNQAGGIDNSYTAAYWPWLQTIDPNSAQLVYIPASTFIPGVYAFTDASSDPWFAPAGITRGGMGQVVRAERKLTSTNRDTLYEANINPIATFPQQGVVVFGQKTLQKAASALDRVNVRRLLITLKDFISQIADNLVFEQNTIATRQNFLTQVNPYLESVQQRQGLFAFKVVMDENNNTPDVIDRNELIGQIFLQPTRTAEFILLDFNVLPTGATFPA